MRIEIVHSLHNTFVTVPVLEVFESLYGKIARISVSDEQLAESALCGMEDCQCGHMRWIGTDLDTGENYTVGTRQYPDG